MGSGPHRFLCLTVLLAIRFIFLGLCLPVVGQYRLSHIGDEQGLSQGHVFCVLQDSRGFMWFGTRDGLNRYDGYKAKIYRHDPKDPNSISNNYIYALSEDASGALWIGTRGGLNRFDRDEERFTRFRNDPNDPNSLSHNTVRALLGGTHQLENSLWIGTAGGGLSHLNLESFQFTHFKYETGNETSLGSDNLSSLALGADNTIWICPWEDGINKMSLLEPGKFTRYNERAEMALYSKKNRVLWVATEGGLKRFNPERADPFEPVMHPDGSPFQPIQTIMETQDGALWVGTLDDGLYQFDYLSGQISNWQQDPGDSGTLAQNTVTSLFQDNKGNIWVGSYGRGLTLMIPNPFHHYRGGPTGEAVGAILRDKTGKLWLGTEKSGLLQYNKELTQSEVDTSKTNILSLLEDHEGNLWVGTLATGLIPPNIARLKNNPVIKSLSNIPIWALFEDSDRALWVGTSDGLNRIDADRSSIASYRHNVTKANSLSDDYINCIYGGLHPDEPLWIGTMGGLNRMDRKHPGRFTSYQYKNGNATTLSADVVYTIHQDSTGSLWVGTSNGLNHFDPVSEKAYSFLNPEEHSSNIIYSILGDDEGHLWLSTPKGLSRFNAQTEEFRAFNRFYGLAVEDFRQGCGFRDSSGRLFFGGTGGVIAFFPEDVVSDTSAPQMVITSFFLDNQLVLPRFYDPASPLVKSIEETQSIELSYKNRDLAFRFAALDYSAPQKNGHQYRLEGYDESWIETQASDRRANYTNLDPGHYTFRIMGSNKDGVWSAEKHLKIHIPAPPWLSYWAFSLYALALISVVAGYVHRQRQTLVQERRITERLRQVDALKDEFLANTSHELRTPLHGMVGLAEGLIDGVTGDLPESTRANLAMIVRSGRRLGNLVNDILDFEKLKSKGLNLQFRAVDLHSLVEVVVALSKPLARAKKLRLINEIAPSLPPVRADEDRLQQVLHNLMGNAIKFTEAGSITVSAELEQDHVLVSISDTGLGIARADLDRIFRSFEQIDAGMTRVQGGPGLVTPGTTHRISEPGHHRSHG